MATKLTVKRADLVKAIKAKAAANKKAFDQAKAEAGSEHALVETFDKVLNEQCAQEASYTRNASYQKSQVRANFQTYILYALGIIRKPAPAEPKLFEKELAVLEMATDEVLSIDDSSDYFSFLKS